MRFLWSTTIPGRALFVALACAGMSLAACNSERAPSESEVEQRQQALSSTSSGSYTQLTQKQWDEAHLQPWERESAKYERPPQRVIDLMNGRAASKPAPNQQRERRLQNYRAAWAQEKTRLMAQGLSSAEIEQARRAFKYEFLIAGGGK